MLGLEVIINFIGFGTFFFQQKQRHIVLVYDDIGKK